MKYLLFISGVAPLLHGAQTSTKDDKTKLHTKNIGAFLAEKFPEVKTFFPIRCFMEIKNRQAGCLNFQKITR